jgi:hypothetical protein
MELGSKGWRGRAAGPCHLLSDAKLQEQGDIKELAVSALCFEMLTSCKDPCLGGE